MGPQVLRFICIIALFLSPVLAIDPISNPAIVLFKQNHSDIYRAFLRQTQFLVGSVYPVRLVLFPARSYRQKELAKFLEIPEPLYELEVQKASNKSAQPRRVSSDLEMIATVREYVGSLGYLVDSNQVIFNNGGEVVVIEVKK